VTVNGTKNVVEAAIEAGCEAVVVLSTGYVFGRPGGDIDETNEYAPLGAYGRSKARMERWCLARAQTSLRTRVVVLNPSCVYGPGGGTYSDTPARLAKADAFCWINEGRGAANYTFVENLIDAMLLAAGTKRASGQRFIINDGTTTWRNFLGPVLGKAAEELPSYTRAQLRAYERLNKVSIVDVGRAMVADTTVAGFLRQRGRPVIGSLERIAPNLLKKIRTARQSAQSAPTMTESASHMPPSWLAEVFADDQTRYCARKAAKELDWQPRIDLETGQRLTVQWQLGNLLADGTPVPTLTSLPERRRAPLVPEATMCGDDHA